MPKEEEEVSCDIKLHMLDIVVERLKHSKSFPLAMREFLMDFTGWDGKYID